MDDLAGLDWSKSSAKKSPNPSYTGNYNNAAFSTLKPSPPVSGRATPNNASTPAQVASKPTTPANDSFSNLVSFGSNPSTANLSLQEQQKRLAALRVQQQKKQARSLSEQYAGKDDAVWNNLGSGRSTPAIEAQQAASSTPKPTTQDEDDIFAAFNAPAIKSTGRLESKPSQLEDDDDPFELSKQRPARTATTGSSANGFDDDDVLGLLGRPVSRKQEREPLEHPPEEPPPSSDPQDRAIAELVDMGFSADKATQALQTTNSGTDVQAAVSWLLNQAHSEARERSEGRDTSRNGQSPQPVKRQRGSGRIETGRQQWQEQVDEPELRSRRQQSPSAEKDPAQIAAELGSNFLKTANSFWKQSTKRVQQAVQEFNSDSESNQPKWMRDPDATAQPEERSQHRGDEAGTARRRRRSSGTKAREQQSVTDEAMMLETQRPTPPPRQTPRTRPEPRWDSSADTSRDHSPAMPSRLRETHSPQPAFLRQQQAPKPVPQQAAVPSSRAALSRQANEEQAAQAYVSSARRRKPAAQAPALASESELLEGSAKPPVAPKPAFSTPTQPKPATRPSPIPARPVAPTRNIPPVSAISLKASHSHREKGNEHFKRGDYSSAHQAYSASLTHLPAAHPLTIVLLTNRALTALKIGEPKTAITDADTAITLIGISKGESERIDFSNGESPKLMRDYYGKALVRKAEALEQMEKWSDAAGVWREAVEGNHGGATSMQGRLRAEKAAAPTSAKPKPKPKPAATRRPPPRPSPSSTNQNSEAVSALRAANAAADKADDERFALSDSVDARLKTWKEGKQDNLRALLGSLDTVLWEGSGWKKISMADLVLPGKVKVQYMKGIGKVHPDKIPTDATTEQRMIAGAVFSTLNEAWDKFRRENGL